MSLQNLKSNLLKLQNILEDHEGVELNVEIKDETWYVSVSWKNELFIDKIHPIAIKLTRWWSKSAILELSDAILGELGYDVDDRI